MGTTTYYCLSFYFIHTHHYYHLPDIKVLKGSNQKPSKPLPTARQLSYNQHVHRKGHQTTQSQALFCRVWSGIIGGNFWQIPRENLSQVKHL